MENGALTIRNGFTHYPQQREIIRYFRGDVALPERISKLLQPGFDTSGAHLGARSIEIKRSMPHTTNAVGAHRAAQTGVCRDPRTDRRWKIKSTGSRTPLLTWEMYRTAARRKG